MELNKRGVIGNELQSWTLKKSGGRRGRSFKEMKILPGAALGIGLLRGQNQFLFAGSQAVFGSR